MKNKEKFAKEIVEIACDGSGLSVNKATGKPTKCVDISCEECLRHDERNICGQKLLRQWAESEYIEKPVISKRDRAFLEYLGKELKYIAREAGGNLMAYECNVSKGESGWIYDWGAIKSFFRLNVQFPMVKWEDSKPWLIEDLKRLEVVDSYE